MCGKETKVPVIEEGEILHRKALDMTSIGAFLCEIGNLTTPGKKRECAQALVKAIRKAHGGDKIEKIVLGPELFARVTALLQLKG